VGPTAVELTAVELTALELAEKVTRADSVELDGDAQPVDG